MDLIINPIFQVRKLRHEEYISHFLWLCNKVPQTCCLKTKGSDLSQNNVGSQRSKISSIGWKLRCQLIQSLKGPCRLGLWWLPEFLGFWPHHPKLPSLHDRIVFSSFVCVQSPSAHLLQGYIWLHLGPPKYFSPYPWACIYYLNWKKELCPFCN